MSGLRIVAVIGAEQRGPGSDELRLKSVMQETDPTASISNVAVRIILTQAKVVCAVG